MQSKMSYILVFVGTLVLAEVIMMMLAMVKPEIFKKPGASADSTGVPAAKVRKDSSHVIAADSLASLEQIAGTHAVPNTESAAFDQKSDSIALLLSKLKISEKKIADLESKNTGEVPKIVKSVPSDSARTKDRKMLVKMLEAMSPDNAARIIESFQDSDAREILMGIKSRQAGKILSAMNVDRASKLMR